MTKQAAACRQCGESDLDLYADGLCPLCHPLTDSEMDFIGRVLALIPDDFIERLTSGEIPPRAPQPWFSAIAFVRRLAYEGGMIVSSAGLTPAQIAVAQAEGRLFVDDENLGFVIVPAKQRDV